MELSVEETNALRLKLGLKPLRINQNQLKQEEEGKKRKRDQEQEQEKKPDEKETQKEDTARLKDKLLAIREERLAREKVDAGRIVRPLGEPSDDDGEDDLRSWVKKSRERERREQEAERTRRALQEQEGFGEDGEDEGEASDRKSVV